MVKGVPFPFDPVVEALLKAGNKALLFEISGSIKDADARDRALSGLASALAKAGEVNDAAALAQGARQAVDRRADDRDAGPQASTALCDHDSSREGTTCTVACAM